MRSSSAIPQLVLSLGAYRQCERVRGLLPPLHPPPEPAPTPPCRLASRRQCRPIPPRAARHSPATEPLSLWSLREPPNPQPGEKSSAPCSAVRSRPQCRTEPTAAGLRRRAYLHPKPPAV